MSDNHQYLYPLPNKAAYEQETQYNTPQTYYSVASPSEVVKPGSEDGNSGNKLSPRFWKIFACLVFLSNVAAIAGVYYIVVVVQSSKHIPGNASVNSNIGHTGNPHISVSTSNGTSTSLATSCLNLKNTSGVLSDGYYFIQPSGNIAPFQVFCDMITAGGGWTLVASVHENDINGKCTTGDMWFSNDLPQYSIFSRNWENTNIFGNVKEATSADYKNIGYSAMKASNLMLRHVPNKTPVDESRSFASLQYHTSNNFLDKYGANLFTTYTMHYPMNPTATVTYPPNINKLVDAIAALSTNLTSGIPDFYKYTYGTLTDRLQNGGNNTFTNFGMHISLEINCTSTMDYGVEFKCPASRTISVSRKSHPFILVTAIENPNFHSYGHYYIHGYRPSSDPVTSYKGKLTEGNFELQYRARCIYGRNVPSVCDVVFAVNNTKVGLLYF
ncbi:uncharacterized protein LOC144747153 [Ciona intestinalis]